MKIRVIDLETTGFEPPEHAPCEVGFVDLDSYSTDLAGEPSYWAVSQPRSWLCHPGRSIPPEASAIHHIIDSDVELEERWSVAMPAHDETIDIYCAHNAKFEQVFITPEMIGGRPWICTYKCALRLWPDAPSHSNQALRYWLGLWFGINRAYADNAHRAGPDAYVTAHILLRMLETPGVTIQQLLEWSEKPALLVKCHIGGWRGTRWEDIDDPSFLDWILRRDFDENMMFTARHHLNRLMQAEKDGAKQ